MNSLKAFMFIIFITNVSFSVVFGNLTYNVMKRSTEEERMRFLAAVVKTNLNSTKFTNILIVGHFEDIFYKTIQTSGYTFSITNIEKQDQELNEIVEYRSNTIIIDCLNFENYEKALLTTIKTTYYYALSKVIIYYHVKEENLAIAKILFILWYYRMANAILIQYDDAEEIVYLSYYNPYIHDDYKLQNNFGCRTARKIGFPLDGFVKSFICEEGCQNVSLHSNYRGNFLGTCLGFNTYAVSVYNSTALENMHLFIEKGKNLHGYILRAYVTEVLPFMKITEIGNGSYILESRDGTIWRTLSQLLNFSIDLSPCEKEMKQNFNYELIIQQIYSFSHRKTDLYIGPVYQIDLIIVELDYATAHRDSGVCILSHRADFETILFDLKLLQDNFLLLMNFLFCFVGIWFVFILFSIKHTGNITLNQVGKNFMNAVRNVLSISIYKLPRGHSFRIFFTVTVWSFFVMNFATQAAITSFFTAFKRGKEIETFDDVIEKGYPIEGMASPDIMLPDTEEKYDKLNSKLVAVDSLFECLRRMPNDSQRFCLIDCALGQYLVRNQLNNKGEQYLHLVKDRFHNHPLSMIFHKNSPLTYWYNKHILRMIEAGLVKKWEEYRFNDIKDEFSFKSLGMDEFLGIFEGYALLCAQCFVIFLFEVTIGIIISMTRRLYSKLSNYLTQSSSSSSSQPQDVHCWT